MRFCVHLQTHAIRNNISELISILDLINLCVCVCVQSIWIRERNVLFSLDAPKKVRGMRKESGAKAPMDKAKKELADAGEMSVSE